MSELLKIPSSLVSVTWLHKYRNAENLIILDATLPMVTLKKEVENPIKKRIPNARFFDIKTEFSDPEGAFPNTMLSANVFEKQAQRLGVNKDSCVVVYDDHGIYSAPRAWWSFKAMGFHNIAVLDGGLPAWISEGLEIEDPFSSTFSKGDFESDQGRELFVNAKDVLEYINNPVISILDARSTERFYGRAEEPRVGVRSGHIPSSKSFPYGTVLSSGKLKSKEVLSKLYSDSNPNANKIVFSCGTGITACVLALGADIAGYQNIAVYDGSWTEWGSSPDLPIEK